MARFMRRGKARVYFLPTVLSATTAPTSAEVAAGTDMTGKIADMSGWLLEASKIDTPDLSSRFVSSVPGEQSVKDSGLTFYGDDIGTTDAIKTALAVDTIGYVYLCHSGVGVGKPADLFPVRVMSVGNEYSLGTDPARYMIGFAITAPPRVDIAQL